MDKWYLAIQRLNERGIECSSLAYGRKYWKIRLLQLVEQSNDHFARMYGTTEMYADMRMMINNMVDMADEKGILKEVISEFVLTHTSHAILDLLDN